MKSKLLLCVGGLTLAAMGLLAAAPEKKPNTEGARLNNLGCAYMNQQLFEKALKSFEDASATDPNLGIATLNQGIALSSLGKVDEAKVLLDRAAKANPKDPHVWYALGMLDKNSSNPEAAVEDFKRVIELDDTDVDTWYFLGTVYSQVRQFPQAIDAFQHALKLNPNHASATFGLSRAYQQAGDSANARERLARFQYITAHKLGSAMSLAYGEQGKYSLAEESPASMTKVSAQIPIKFVDVTSEAGLSTSETQANSFGAGPGACFFDYDNDGKVDLLLPGGSHGVILYHNLGAGKFEDVTTRSGIDLGFQAVGCTAGDYDNDGLPDLAVAVNGRVVLLHNDKNGTFKDVTSAAGIQSEGAAAGITFIDYDHDGDLDLYIVQAAEKGAGNGQSASSEPAKGDPANHASQLWRNNGDGTFTNQTAETGLGTAGLLLGALGTDYNNDRAVDIVAPGHFSPVLLRNPREGKFELESFFQEKQEDPNQRPIEAARGRGGVGAAVLDYDHDGWMDIAFTYSSASALVLWHNDHGKRFEQVPLPDINWSRAFGVAALDYDNDGWVDLVAVGEAKDGRAEIKLLRNLGPDGWKDVTADAGLDKIQLKDPRAIIIGDYDNDGGIDLLITQNHGPAVLLKNEGGNKNNWLRLALKGLNDNKSAIGTKVEVFSDGIRQKYEIYGSNGYLGQNSPFLTVGLGQAKQADVVRMLWPGGVLQDEVEVAGNKQQEFLELDRRGSSCPTLFVWDGKHYQLVADVLGAGVIGHWVAPGERNIPRPVEWVKVDRNLISSKNSEGPSSPVPVANGRDVLSFRLMEPMEEVVYLDAVKLVAVDHPSDQEVYPNEYFASNPPYPEFKVITSRGAKPPAGAWDDKGNDLLPDLLSHKYVGNFDLLPFKGFAKPHSLILDLGEPYSGGPLRLLMHGEIEYFTATGMYAASQAGIEATAPYVEAEVSNGRMGRTFSSDQGSIRSSQESQTALENRGSKNSTVAQRRYAHSRARKCRECGSKEASPSRDRASTRWVRVLDDMGFPAGLPRTITTALTGKLPRGTTRIRVTTNLQIYWDNILIDRSSESNSFKLHEIPLSNAQLGFHGYPKQIEDLPPGNVKYVYEQVSQTGPYARQAGGYTRYGDVLPLLKGSDDKLAIFGSGEEVQLDFDPSQLPALPKGWSRDYFFFANGYEKDMDFYAADGSTVEPLPFRGMGIYPYPSKSFPRDPEHRDYMLRYNTRFVSGREPRGYAYKYGK